MLEYEKKNLNLFHVFSIPLTRACMSHKPIILTCLFIAFFSLIFVNLAENWMFIVIGLLSAGSSLILASLLLILREKRQWQPLKSEKETI